MQVQIVNLLSGGFNLFIMLSLLAMHLDNVL